MNLKVRYENPKNIIPITFIIYLVAIFLGHVLKVSHSELDKDSLFWTTSTIIQAFGALLALSAVYSIYRIQNYEKDLADSRTKIIFIIKKIVREIKVPVPINLSNKGEFTDLTWNEDDIEFLESLGPYEFVRTVQQYQEKLKKKIKEEGGAKEFRHRTLSSRFNEYNGIVDTIHDYKKSIKYSLYLIGVNISLALLFLPHFTIKSSNPIISLFLEESVVISFLIFFSAYCLLELIVSMKNSIGK